MDLDQMHAYPVVLSFGGGGADSESAGELPVYHDVSTASLAERCAGAASEWGTDKVAAVGDPTALYKDAAAHPLVLQLMVLDRYGNESMDWDPEVLRATMMRDRYQVSGTNWAKLMAARTLLMSPSPWRQWEVFHWVARALAGFPPNFTFLEEPVLGHLFSCVDIMKICDPAREFQLEIDKFVAAALRHEGHVYAPESLSFAQRELEEPKVRCTACLAEFADNNDVKCVTCGSASLERLPYAFAGLRDACAALWRPRRASPLERAVDGLPDEPAGNLVYDLLVHWDFATGVRKQLLAQLRSLAR